jgi:hypothetical protein
MAVYPWLILRTATPWEDGFNLFLVVLPQARRMGIYVFSAF